jgi:hypothetical protein
MGAQVGSGIPKFLYSPIAANSIEQGRSDTRPSNREASHARAAARPHTNGAEALIWWIGSLLVRGASRTVVRPC